MPWLYKTPAHGPASSFFGFAARCVGPERSSNGLLRGCNAGGLLPSPVIGERCHRSLACGLVAEGFAIQNRQSRGNPLFRTLLLGSYPRCACSVTRPCAGVKREAQEDWRRS
jgi:hypothetical protein